MVRFINENGIGTTSKDLNGPIFGSDNSPTINDNRFFKNWKDTFFLIISLIITLSFRLHAEEYFKQWLQIDPLLSRITIGSIGSELDICSLCNAIIDGEKTNDFQSR